MPTARLNYWEASQQSVGPYALDDAPVDLKLSVRPKEECVRRTVTVRYGELDIAVSCYIEPAEPEIGLHSPAVYIEEIELPHVDNIYVADFVYDRYDKDQMFAMVLQDLIRKALEEGARQAKEDVDHYPKLDMVKYAKQVCTRPCIDRRDPWSAPQDSAGPMAKAGGTR